MAKFDDSVIVPVEVNITITMPEAMDFDRAAAIVREQAETQIREFFAPAAARVAALEAEREKLRAVVLAVAEGFDAIGVTEHNDEIARVACNMAVAIDEHVGLGGEGFASWAQSSAALRALAGAP